MKKKDFIKKKLNSISEFFSIEDDYELIKFHSKDWRRRFSNVAYGVIFPKSSEEISKILKFANKHNLKLIPQGGNTGLVGGTSPSRNKSEIIINLTKMNKILEIDENNRTVELEAGTIIENANKELKKKNFIFPTDMSSIGSSQIGGVIATNAGGMNVIRYGLIRNNILALEVVLANGDILELGSNLIKDNTGYNLKDIFCGSEGTLGIITKARIKVYPNPLDDLTIFFSIKSIKDLLNVYSFLDNKFSNKIEKIELISDLSFELCIKHKLLNKRIFNQKSDYYLLVKLVYFDISEKKENDLENLFSNLEHSFQDVLISQNEKESREFWEFREALTEAQKIDGNLMGFDLSVPLNHLEKFLDISKKKINQIVPNIKFHIFGHVGDSNIHFNLIEPDNSTKNFYKYEKKIKDIINNLMIEFKGSVSAEHGIGILKKDDLIKTKNLKEIKLMKKMKKLFDPKNTLNPNKIF